MLRNRLILAALWILSLVCISFYGGPISYGFFAVITLIPVICLIYLLLVLARFKIYQHFESKDIVSNHKTPFYFTLQNEDLFAFCAVRVNFYSDFSTIHGLRDDVEYELLPKDSIKKETVLVCKYRGEYFVGIKSVTLRDFLCLFKITYKNPEPLRVTVVPNIIRLADLRNIDIDILSQRETLRAGTDPDVLVRKYVQGDDIRHISWKQSARVGEPMVRRFIGEEKTGIALITDPTRLSDKDSEYLPVENRILEISIALTLFMEEKRIPVSVYERDTVIKETPVNGPAEFDSFYTKISTFSFRDDIDRASLFAEFSRISGIYEKRTVFFVTALLDDALLKMCRQLNQNDTEAFVYLVKDGLSEAGFTSPTSHTHIMTMPVNEDLSKLM